MNEYQLVHKMTPAPLTHMKRHGNKQHKKQQQQHFSQQVQSLGVRKALSITARNSPPSNAIGPNIARRSPWTAWWKQQLLNAIKRPGFTSTTCWFRADSSVKMSEPAPLNQMITVWLLTMRPFQTSRWLLTSPRLIMAGRIAIGPISPISSMPKALWTFCTRWPGTCTLALRPVPLFTKPGSWKSWNCAKPCCSNCSKAEFSSDASRKSSMMMRSDKSACFDAIGCFSTRVRLVLNSTGGFEHCTKSYTSIMPHWYSIVIDIMPVGCVAKSSPLTVEGRLLLEVPALRLKWSAIFDIFSLHTPPTNLTDYKSLS